ADWGLATAERAARRAIEFDRSLAEPHAVLALVLGDRRRFLEARDAYRGALELDPDDTTTNFWFATSLASEGYLGRASQILDRVLILDPLYPNALNWRAMNAIAAGDLELADRLARRSRDAGLMQAGLSLSYIAEARGQREEAVSGLAEGLRPLAYDLPAGAVEAIARGALGDAQAREQTLALLDRYLAKRPAVVGGVV